MVDTKHVQVWRLVKDGTTLHVATINQEKGQVPAKCEGCSAPCCQGMFKPILNAEEFLSNKFPTHLANVPEYLKKEGIPVDKLAVLAIANNVPCSFFDISTSTCTIFPNCPAACLSYDCRDDPRLEEFVKLRGGK